MELFVLALVLSLDNVRLAAALGGLVSDRRQWWLLAALMAAIEAGFPVIGASFGITGFSGAELFEYLGGALLVLAGLLTLAGMKYGAQIRNGRSLYLLPVLFGIDNLVAGAAIGTLGSVLISAVVVGLISGVVSLLTMAAVGLLVERLRSRATYLPGALAVSLGLSFFFAS